MYFVKRGDKYIDVSGKSFRDFFAGKLPDCRASGRRFRTGPITLSTIFPEVRLKRYLEMRGADGGPWRRLPSLTAYWVGLLYDDDALDACWDMVKGWTARGAAEAARRRAEARLQGRDPQAQYVHAGAGNAAAVLARARAPQAARPQRPRRDALSAAAGRIDCARHHAGRRIAGEVFTANGTIRSSRF